MTDKQLQKELEALRAEVAALSDARSTEHRQEPQAEETSTEAEAPLDDAAAVTDAAAIDIDDPAAVQSHVHELLARLEDEVRDMPAITTLAVFSLGVLFGRLLR